MDDFGTRYSSLSYLQSFPVDKIKIDKSFISGIKENAQSSAIVRAVINLGRGSQLPVVAEGVETKDQLKFLSDEACEEIQGYFIGLPKPIYEYAEMVGRPREGQPWRREPTGGALIEFPGLRPGDHVVICRHRNEGVGAACRAAASGLARGGGFG